MRLNETKRKQRTSQEEVLAEMFAEAELQDSVRKKKNWDAWMESEVEQQIDEEIRKYLAESSDPTVYLTPKEAKAWNRMPKSKQQRLLQKESQQVFKEWQAGERKAFAGAESRPDDLREDLVFLQSGRIRLGKQRTGMAGQARIWKPGRLPRMQEKSKGKGNVRSVPERMQRESGNAKIGRTGGMGAGSGVDVVGSYSSGGSSGTAGAQKTAASAAGSTAPVTPATLATRTAKKTAHTFKEYIQGVNQAAQQAIGEERAKLEDSKQQNAQVGDLPSFVKYVGATIGSVVLAGAAMVMQLAAALLTVLVTMLAFLLVAVLAISLIVSVIMSLIGGFLDQQPATGHGLPPFITEDMMEAFFAVQEESGIPVSTGVAQVIAESGFGLYGPGGDNGQGLSQLAYEYKNLFGIKYFSGDQYAIGGVDLSTGEETGNGNTTITAAFSVYPDYGACIRQRGWMFSREPYASKVSAYRNKNDKNYSKEDARGFMNGIRAAGWATDSSYVEKCVQHMDNYNLYRFDNMTYEEYQKSGGGNYD
ncbi:glucosaminidase domain-containing protein, partial [[Ruminococcus] gnavus]